MIDIKDKSKCCGCSACVQKCPKQCISMLLDEEGFYYPSVDVSKCVGCGLCDNVCPVLHKHDKVAPLQVYEAHIHNESIRLHSSSGGVFTALAENVIDQGGVVFGARFDDEWAVYHSWTNNKDGLALFRGSKYVQSRIEATYKEAESFLKEGKRVLFSGTGCQIAGLKRYLNIDYTNLLTVDIICHGVPSPKVWREYLKYVLSSNKFPRKRNDGSSPDIKCVLTDISFRDKVKGWKNFSFVMRGRLTSEYANNSVLHDEQFLFSEDKYENIFFKGFFSNVFIRPSCFHCPSRCSHSSADITLADFWGIDKIDASRFDDKGSSIVILNTDKGVKYFSNLEGIDAQEYPLSVAVSQNPSYFKDNKVPGNRALFWESFKKGVDIFDCIDRYAKPNIKERLYSFAVKLVIRLNLLKFLKSILKR